MQVNQQLVVAGTAFAVSIYLCWSALAGDGGWTDESGGADAWPLPPPVELPDAIDLDGVWGPFPLPEDDGIVDTRKGKRIRTGRDLLTEGAPTSSAEQEEEEEEEEEDHEVLTAVEDESSAAPIRTLPRYLGPPPTKKKAPLVPLPPVEMPGLRLVGLSEVGGERWAMVGDDLEGVDAIVRRGDKVRDAFVSSIDAMRVVLRATDGEARLQFSEVQELDNAMVALDPDPVLAGEPSVPALTGLPAALPGVLALVPGLSSLIPGLGAVAVPEPADPTGAALGLTGLEPDDLLLAVNGKPVSTLDEARAVLQAAPKGQPLNIDVRRQGAKLTLKLPN